MHEMSVTATEVANNAQGAASAAKEADQATVEGSSIVGESTQTINMLSDSIDLAVEEVQVLESATANIETILKVINDIADQTNLLALNAAIEAARAENLAEASPLLQMKYVHWHNALKSRQQRFVL